VPNGWLLYDPLQEFTRQGCFRADGSSDEWFLIDNSAFKLSPTYPAKFVMPLHLTKVRVRVGRWGGGRGHG
jgi:hypothetical protein